MSFPNYELIKRLRSKFLQTGFISLLNGEGVDLINHLYEHYHETRNLTARVAELEEANALLVGDREMLDWLEKESPSIYFNGAGHWAIDCGGDRVYSANTLRAAIAKAMNK